MKILCLSLHEKKSHKYFYARNYFSLLLILLALNNNKALTWHKAAEIPPRTGPSQKIQTFENLHKNLKFKSVHCEGWLYLLLLTCSLQRPGPEPAQGWQFPCKRPGRPCRPPPLRCQGWKTFLHGPEIHLHIVWSVSTTFHQLISMDHPRWAVNNFDDAAVSANFPTKDVVVEGMFKIFI